MSSNKSARQKLERLYGKKCMIEKLGIRYIPKKERRKIKGYTKYDDCLTFHHIREKHNGGETTAENGALLKGYNHRWLHSLPDYQKEQINEVLQQYKLHVLAKRMEIDNGGSIQEIEEDIVLDFDPSEFIKLPAFDTDKKPKKIKFNRAKEKQALQRYIDEVLYGTNDNDIEDNDDYMEEVGAKMPTKLSSKDLILRKLKNTVKGHAQGVLRSEEMTKEEKKADFSLVEDITKYITEYDENQRKLADYDRMKAEYEQWRQNMIDDGR